MADGNKNNEETNNNNEDDAENQQQNEYFPNVVRAEPDIGLGGRTRRSKEGTHSRREDNPISFRHFLQNESGSTTSSSSAAFPDLYRCSRQERMNTDGPSLLDPESPDLPDFVQDHLALEHMYFNNDSQSSSFNVKNLPDFASYALNLEQTSEGSSDQRYSGRGYRPYEEGRRSRRNRVPLDLPVPNFMADESQPPLRGPSLPFDLTTQTNSLSATAPAGVHSPTETERSGTGGRLPDFLSDGHVLGHSNSRHRDARIVTSENGNTSEASSERHNLIITLRTENSRLRDEISIIQSILTKKDDRIKELEDLVMALEISKLQMSTDANTQTSKLQTEDEIRVLKQELAVSKKEVLKLRKGAKQNSSTESNETLSSVSKLKDMTDNSENLTRQLLQVIMQMQLELETEANNQSEKIEEKNKKDPPNADDPSTSNG